MSFLVQSIFQRIRVRPPEYDPYYDLESIACQADLSDAAFLKNFRDLFLRQTRQSHSFVSRPQPCHRYFLHHPLKKLAWILPVLWQWKWQEVSLDFGAAVGLINLVR